MEHLFLFAFNSFILNIYTLRSWSVFQFGSRCVLHRYHARFYYLETRSVFPIFHAPYFLFYTLRIFRENYLLGFKNISVFLICKVLNYVLCQQCNCSFNFGMENSTITITEKKIQIFVILIIYHNSPSLTWLKTLTQLETREPGNAKTWQYVLAKPGSLFSR